MTLPYGFAKATVKGDPWLKGTRANRETQYHVHADLNVGGQTWDMAVNVGTDDADDLLRYRLVFDFHYSLTSQLSTAPVGSTELTGTNQLPALDYQRSDVLVETGRWRSSDVMDGSENVEPVASIMRLLGRAKANNLTVYVFGRFYKEGDGIHDIHMNQGSTGRFLHRPGNDRNDHNDIWQDGALLVDIADGRWAAYFSAFEKQFLPTNDLGNPTENAETVRTPG